MLDIPAKTIDVGLIGSGIQKSLSPALHRQEGRANGLTLRYELLDLDRRGVGLETLPDLLSEAEARGFAGVNVTHPAKQAVIAFLDELSPEAKALGAVNTVVFRDGRRTGHNTDGFGFAEGFRRGLPGADMGFVVQLGAGGAGAAVAHATMGLGTSRLSIFDRDAGRAQALAADLRTLHPQAAVEAGTDLGAAMAAATGLVHATPTGMAAHPGLPLPAAMLRAGLWVAEVVYVPLETELLRAARLAGCRTADGGGMAVFQAAGAFRLFTGVEPDSERMLAHFASIVT